MKIDKRLNLVLEVELEDKTSAFVHHTPISKEQYDMSYLFLNDVVYSLYSKFPNPIVCSRICHRHMTKLAADNPEYKTIFTNLSDDAWRLTNVAMPVQGEGFKPFPFFDVMQRKLLSEEDIEEVKSFILFFTAASWVHGRKERGGLYEIFNGAGVQTTSLVFMEYVRSLPTLKTAENSGVTATA
jgi:hypothetical protein